MLRCRCVTFDIVNTLLRVVGSPAERYAEVAQKHGVNVVTSRLSEVYRPTMSALAKELPSYGAESGITSRQWWTEFVGRVLRNAGCESEDRTYLRIAEELCDGFEAGENWEVLPNSLTVLKEVKRRGFKVGAVSNFDNTLEAALKRQELREHFDFLVTAVSARSWKPDPKMYLKAAEVADMDPQNVVHIGDDLEKDYHAARSCGMNALLLDTTSVYEQSAEVPQEHVIRDIQELMGKITYH